MGVCRGFAQEPGNAPVAYLVGGAHLDSQWNWDVTATINEYLPNTARQNLFLLERYPSYIFNFEGGVKYAWMKEYYPDLYRRVKQQIAAGADMQVGCADLPGVYQGGQFFLGGILQEAVGIYL